MIEIDIDKHTLAVSDILGMGRNLLNENEIRPRNIDSIPRAIRSIEERWKLFSSLLRRRKFE